MVTTNYLAYRRRGKVDAAHQIWPWTPTAVAEAHWLTLAIQEICSQAAVPFSLISFTIYDKMGSIFLKAIIIL
jgi:hypothetical protein